LRTRLSVAHSSFSCALAFQLHTRLSVAHSLFLGALTLLTNTTFRMLFTTSMFTHLPHIAISSTVLRCIHLEELQSHAAGLF
ncbi:hypothetical protein EV426DRAFT_628557, partial [Tirmania nivea]